MTINMIVAMDRNNAIGRENALPWHLRNDLQHFKRVTEGTAVIMGRKTFESIGKPLPNRVNIVLTKDKSWKPTGNVNVVHGIYQSLSMAEAMNAKEIFVIGGQDIYEQYLDYASKLYITHVDTFVGLADAYFPTIDWKRWDRLAYIEYPATEHDQFPHATAVYVRKKLKEE